MELDSIKHSLKRKLADELLQKLLSVYEENFQVFCLQLGFPVKDLQPKPYESFSEKGTPSTAKNYRFIHYEERRIAKILKAATEFYNPINNNLQSASPSLLSLLKALHLPIMFGTNFNASSTMSMEPSISFKNHSEFLQQNIERSKQKFNKSLQVIKRLEFLKAEEVRKTEELMRKSAEREKKLILELNKRDEKMGKAKNNVYEQRNRILKKRKDIENEIDKQAFAFASKLEERMGKLGEINKKRLKDMVGKQQQKIKKRVSEDCSKSFVDEMQYRQQDSEIKGHIQDLQEKTEKKITNYEDSVQKKINSARENNIKVEKVFTQSIIDSNKREEEKLKKIIEKSILTEEKRSKREEKYRKVSDVVRKSMNSSFARNNKFVENLNNLESKRIQQIENRECLKTQTFYELKDKFEKNNQLKREKNISRFEVHGIKYSEALEHQVWHI